MASKQLAKAYPVLTAIGPFKPINDKGKPTMQKIANNVDAYYRMVTVDGVTENPDQVAAVQGLAQDVVLQCIESIDGTDQAAEDARIAAILKAAGVVAETDDAAGEPEEKDVTEVTADAVKASEAAVTVAVKSAADFIAKAENNEAVNACLANIVAANKTMKMRGILLYDVLRGDGKGSGIYTMAELDAAPMPGTKPDDVKGTNFLPEYTRKYTPKKDGGYREGWVSWFVSAAERIAASKALADREAVLAKKLADAKNVRDYGDKKDAGSSFNACVASLRQAIHLHHQLRACENVPNLRAGWRLQLAADGKTYKPYMTQYPIELQNTRDPSGATAVPLTTFLGLNPSAVAKMTPEEIAKKGGLLSALLGTGGTGAGDEPGGETESVIKNRKQAEGYFSEVAAWLGKRENTEALEKWLNEPAKDSDGTFASIYRMYLEIRPICEARHQRWVNMQDAETAAAEARAKAAKAIADKHNAAVAA